MNKIIKSQLLAVTSCDDLKFDDNTTKMLIKKTVKISGKSLKVGDVYMIKLSQDVTNPQSSSTLASNWNNGVVPKYDMYHAEIVNNIQNMIKINGVAVDDSTSQFVGWLPYDLFTVIEKE